MSDTILSVRDVGIAFARRRFPFSRKAKYSWALKNVSFDVGQGETVGIIGRNGAGKSTMLKLLAGLIAPDSGSITRAPLRASLLSLQVGFLPHLSGRENAILSGLLLGLTKAEAYGNLEAVFALAELTDVANEPLFTYSSGMRARLGFSVAYFAAPEVLLIDEVLGVGDVGFRAKSSEAIKNLIQSNRTVVLVSHHSATMRELCDRIVWIEEGVTRQIGPPDPVLLAYQKYVEQLERDTGAVANPTAHAGN